MYIRRRFKIILRVFIFFLLTGISITAIYFYRSRNTDIVPTDEKLGLWHEVKRGETIWDIARFYNTTMGVIITANRLTEPDLIQPGTKLFIPIGSALSDINGIWHMIAAGETIWDIAKRYKTSMQSIITSNKLTTPNQIKPGTKLFIPTGATFSEEKGRWYKIKKGDTIWSIAQRYKVNWRSIIRANPHVSTKKLHIGEEIFIPGEDSTSSIVSRSEKRESPPIQTDTQRRSSLDSQLEADIEHYIKRLRRSGKLTPTDRTSFVVYDISMQKKVTSINEDQRMMAASIIKNFVMLAYFHEVKHNRLQHTNKNRRHLRKMIQNSSNSSTNYFIRLLGGPSKVTQILNFNYRYFDRTKILEYIPRSGRTYRNTTSAHDLNRFYNQLWLGNLPHSDKMKYYLALPNRDRIYTGTYIPPGVKVYNKTGTVYGLVGDSGILLIKAPNGQKKAYAFTALIEDKTRTRVTNRSKPYSTWVNERTNIIRRVSEGVYEYIYQVHYGGLVRNPHGVLNNKGN